MEKFFGLLLIIILIVIIMLSSFLLEKKFNKFRDKYEWDKPPKFYFYIGMFIPIVGFIMWCIFVNHKPNSARSSGRGALCSILLQVLVILGIFAVRYSITFARDYIFVDEYTETYNVIIDSSIELDKKETTVTINFKGYKEYIKKFKEYSSELIFPNKTITLYLKDTNIEDFDSYDLVPYIEEYINSFKKQYENHIITYLKFNINEKEIIINKVKPDFTMIPDDEIALYIPINTMKDYNDDILNVGDGVDVYLIDDSQKVFVNLLNNIKIIAFKDNYAETITSGTPTTFFTSCKEEDCMNYRKASYYQNLEKINIVIIKHNKKLELNDYQEVDSVNTYIEMKKNSNEVPYETFGIEDNIEEVY